ncbi:MAG: nuclear transport factor 2 family protein [Acidimicrobiales bacterium]|jgi:ketosteroid isomerase-like protein
MGTEENKAVVLRFMTEVLASGNVDLVDELLAPDYVNRAMGDADLTGFKAMLGGMGAVMAHARTEIESLVAEGDAVVARWTMEVPTAGKTISARGLTYYRLADGRIVEDDPFVTPDLMQELGLQMPPPSP